MLIQTLLAVSLTLFESNLAQSQGVGVLFMTAPDTTKTMPKDPVLLAAPRPGVPNGFDLVDASGTILKPEIDPEDETRRILVLKPLAGRKFVKSGDHYTLWNSLGKPVNLESPQVEIGSVGGKTVLYDDNFQSIPIPSVPRDAPASLLSTTKDLTALTGSSEGARDALKSWLGNPETINRALGSLLSSNEGWAWLKDLNLEFKMLDTKNGDQTLGVGYDIKKSFNPDDWSFGPDGSVTGLDYSFSAEGDVAFDRDENPNDFLRTQLSMSWFRSTGGLTQFKPGEKEAFVKDFNALGDLLVTTKNAADSDVGRAIMQKYQSRCSTMYYWDAGLDAALESNQAFTEKNYTVGTHLGFNVSDGRPDSPWSQFNLVDFPAALLRIFTGYEKSFQPRGNAVPWIVVGMDHVQPDGDDPRAVAGDSSDYWRGRAELAYRAPVARFDGVEYYLGASWRAYQEIDAPRSVKDAEADAHSRFVLTLASAKGLFASYSTGDLPFDEQGTDSFALGWAVNF